MKLKTLMLAVGAAFGLTFAAGSAQALTIAQIIAANPNFQFEDNYVEIQGVDQGNDSILDVGDSLIGIAEFQAITNLDTTDNIPLIPPINNHLSAVFEVEVISKTDNGDGTFDFVFGPSATFANGPDGIGGTADDYPAGTMIAFYEDDTDNVIFGGATCTDPSSGGDCEQNVTDGTLILAIGIDDDPDAFWAAFDAPEDPSTGTTESSSSDLGGFNFQLETLFSAIGEFGENKDTFIDGLPGGNNLVEWLGSGTVKGTSDLTTEYHISGDTDVTAEAIPEPSTLGLMGAGLLALAGFARRRFRKAA